MDYTEEKPEHIYSEDDDVVVKRFQREQTKLVEFKQHIKADILSKIDVGVELLIEEMVVKVMNQFENDDTKKCLFVSICLCQSPLSSNYTGLLFAHHSVQQHGPRRHWWASALLSLFWQEPSGMREDRRQLPRKPKKSFPRIQRCADSSRYRSGYCIHKLKLRSYHTKYPIGSVIGWGIRFRLRNKGG